VWLEVKVEIIADASFVKRGFFFGEEEMDLHCGDTFIDYRPRTSIPILTSMFRIGSIKPKEEFNKCSMTSI
jgi:hypothetical protein